MKLNASILCFVAIMCAANDIQQRSRSMMTIFMNAITGNVDEKIEELQKFGANEDTQENVMMEMGLELLLKEPVMKKVLKSHYWEMHHYFIFQSDREMLKSGGPNAVKFFLDLLNKIKIAEEEDLKNREEHILDFPKPFFFWLINNKIRKIYKICLYIEPVCHKRKM